VLAIFPAVLALSAILGLVGQAEKSVQTVLDVISPLVSEDALGTIEPALLELASSKSAGWALLFGALLALWSASGYVGAFGRAMNRIYEIGEGRPFWKLRPIMLLITFITIVLVALVMLMLVLSGPLAKSIGDEIGLGDQAVQIWNIVKWPVMVIAVMLIVALLYYATPNVKQPKFRWISIGAAVAILIWMLAAVGFAFYVANFASYNKTYGSLAGVVVGLIFLWLTNVALLLGAEIDSELERGRQLQAGIAAESEIQLPARDTRNIEKAAKNEQEDAAKGRRIRQSAGKQTDDTESDHPPEEKPS
jgi:membrane protein